MTGRQVTDGKLVGEDILDLKKQEIRHYEYNYINEKDVSLNNDGKEKKLVKVIPISGFNKKFGSGLSESEISINSMSSWRSLGTLEYKDYFTPYGTLQNELQLWYKYENVPDEVYTINGEQYDMVSTIVSLTIAFLVGEGVVFFAAGKLSPTIGNLISSILGYYGVSVSNGKIKEAFTETVSVDATYYELKAYSPYTGVTKSGFDGGRYYVKTTTSSAFREYVYDGYYKQFITKQDIGPALWLFNEFYSYSFPGVNW